MFCFLKYYKRHSPLLKCFFNQECQHPINLTLSANIQLFMVSNENIPENEHVKHENNSLIFQNNLRRKH